jgi:hypothetical protein
MQMIAMMSLPKALNVLNLRGGGEGRISPLFKFTFTMPKEKEKNKNKNTNNNRIWI